MRKATLGGKAGIPPNNYVVGDTRQLKYLIENSDEDY